MLSHHGRGHPRVAVARGHALCRHAHGVGGHVGHGALHVAVFRRGRGALVVEGAEFVLLGFEVVVRVGAYLAVGTGFMGATVSEISVSGDCPEADMRHD